MGWRLVIFSSFAAVGRVLSVADDYLWTFCLLREHRDGQQPALQCFWNSARDPTTTHHCRLHPPYTHCSAAMLHFLPRAPRLTRHTPRVPAGATFHTSAAPAATAAPPLHTHMRTAARVACWRGGFKGCCCVSGGGRCGDTTLATRSRRAGLPQRRADA